MKPIISIIAAISRNRVLGKDNKLLWHIPEDLQRFKQLTVGHPIIMGRKTFESIGYVLVHRLNIIVTRNKAFKAKGAVIIDSLEAAISIAKAKDSQQIFVIGGGQIYAQALPIADKLYLTIVDKDFSGDTVFPDYSSFSKELNRKEFLSEGVSGVFLELVRP